jgi:uncharacterized protein
VAELAGQADVVVVAIHGVVDGEPFLPALFPDLTRAVGSQARLGVVGGAGSLLASEGGPRLVDTPGFPAVARPEAGAMADVLDVLRASDDELDWFLVSPGAMFGAHNPGERTGAFRVGGDVLLSAEDGTSTISGADFAIAFVDEIEHPAHRRQRFTVAY